MIKRILFVFLFASSLEAASIPAVAYRGATGLSASPVTKPANTMQGDLMVMQVGSTSNNPAVSGWTQIGTTIGPSCDGGGFAYSGLFYKVVTSGDLATANYAFTGSFAKIFTLTNVDVSIPISSSTIETIADGSAGTTTVFTGITTTVDNEMTVVSSLSSDSASATINNSFTERHDPANSEYVATKLIASPGAVGSTTITWTVSECTISFMFGVQPSTGERYYFDSAASAPVTPSSWTAQWDLNTASAVTRRLNSTKGSSTLTWRTFVDNSATNNQDSALSRYVYGPIGAGTITGSFQAILQSYESSTSANCFSQIGIKIITSGGADRGVLYAGQTNTATSGSEYSSTAQSNATNRYFPKPTLSHDLSSVTSTNGDYLVVEIGYRENGTGTTYTCGSYDGEPATDLLQNETETTDNCPWIQFDTALPVYSAGSTTSPGWNNWW